MRAKKINADLNSWDHYSPIRHYFGILYCEILNGEVLRVKLMVFGTGRFYLKRKNYIEMYNTCDEIIGFVDNRANDIQSFENKPVYLPEEIIGKEWDAIVIMSISYLEMRSQLLSLGVPIYKIMCWEAYYARLCGSKTTNFISSNKKEYFKLKVLLVAIPLGLDGSSMAIYYTAIELSLRGYAVTMLVPDCDEYLKDKLLSCGVNVRINRALCFLLEEQYKAFCDFDVVIVNVYSNIRVACELSNYLPTLWWLHEYGKKFDEIYTRIQAIFYEYGSKEQFSKMRIAAVSNWAAEVFQYYHSYQVDAIMPLGIPDNYISKNTCYTENKVSFAVIGGLRELKGQDVLVDAFSILPDTVKNKTTCYIIGACDEKNRFTDEIKEKVDKLPSVVLTGILHRESLKKKIDEVDVIVCSSREETLSIAIIEGMMNGKICITTDATGVAEYIEDGVSGFIVESDNVISLAEKMMYVIQNISHLDNMRQAARDVYEKYFSMKVFGDRLEREIYRTIDEHKFRRNI